MYQVGIIMGGVMPVPAVCGGAIETLIESVVKKYSNKDGFQLTVFSVYHKEAVEAAKKYPEVKFVWTHTNSLWNLFKHSFFLTIRGVTGKTPRVLQRHYNEIAPVIQKKKFDLLIVEGGDEQAVVDIAKGYSRDQLVIHAHIQYHPTEGVAAGYGHMIGVSDFVVNEYKRTCKSQVDAYTLKNAIDIDKFNRIIPEEKKDELRRQLGIQKDDFVVLYVGRFIQMKGILELMEAILSIKDKRVKLLAIGSANFGKCALSPYEKKVKKIASNNRDRIICTGYVNNGKMRNYSALADIQCVPSLCEEAAGLVVLEAMSAGIPTIITKSGGMVEYATSETSIIIDRKDIIKNLTKGILYLKNNENVRKQMSEVAKFHSLQYNEDIYYQNFKEIVKKIRKKNSQ